MATRKAESVIVANMVAHLHSMRRAGEKIHWLKVHGSQYQRAGTPDLHITYRGVSVWIEVKTETGELSPLQSYELREWASAGATIGIARSVDDLSNILSKVSHLS